jgi:hypothetical protein
VNGTPRQPHPVKAPSKSATPLIGDKAETATIVVTEPDPTPLWNFRRVHAEYIGGLREPIIHGVARRGETVNIIAPPKLGKSWLMYALGLSVATGRRWLGTFQTTPGEVLFIDNELHGETIAQRIPKVADALGIGFDEYADRLHVVTLRGRLQNLHSIRRFVEGIERGRFALCILDAWYRFIPPDVSENDNGQMASLYNTLDAYADHLGAAIALVHHASKGVQAGKAVTDVGAGAGSQSRAADAHVVLREHDQPGAVVLDAAVRSFAPLDPVCLRWSFPIWTPAPDLDPDQLRETSRKRSTSVSRADEVAGFVNAYMSATPKLRHEIEDAARGNGVSDHKFKAYLSESQQRGLAYRWTGARVTDPVRFATVPQPPKES